MKKTELIMGMPITVEIVSRSTKVSQTIEETFLFFKKIDQRFSTYKKNSEISKINQGLSRSEWSQEMIEVMDLCQLTKDQTNGFFDIKHDAKLDPSGLVKGWAIYNASIELAKHFTNFYIEAGGDVQVSGHNNDQNLWRVGIRNPFNINEIVKVVGLENQAVATSGNYIRGAHVYNPLTNAPILNPVSLSVIGPDIYQADRYATAAYAMGLDGINFIEKQSNLEGYMIDKFGIATKTSNFERYVI